MNIMLEGGQHHNAGLAAAADGGAPPVTPRRLFSENLTHDAGAFNVLCSPQRPSEDRMKAARAAAAALARAGNHSGYPRTPVSGGGSSSTCSGLHILAANQSVAAAAVRAAAAHATASPGKPSGAS